MSKVITLEGISGDHQLCYLQPFDIVKIVDGSEPEEPKKPEEPKQPDVPKDPPKVDERSKFINILLMVYNIIRRFLISEGVKVKKNERK